MTPPNPTFPVQEIDAATAAALDRAVHHARAYLATLDSAPVAATTARGTLLARLDVPLAVDGVPADRVVDDLAAAVEGGLLGSTSGRFFAWVIGGALPSTVATEWLMTAWDQNAAIYATAPAASVAEEVAGKWLLDLLQLPPQASFGFTTGCQTAHFTALAAARDHLLRQRGWDVAVHGMAGAPPLRVFATPLHHVSLDRALRYLGIGSRQLTMLPVEADGRLAPSTLEAALVANEGPAIVALNAGDLNLGVFDACTDLVPLAQRHGAWVHVDGRSACSRARAPGSTRSRLASTWPTAGRPTATSGSTCRRTAASSPCATPTRTAAASPFVTPISWPKTRLATKSTGARSGRAVRAGSRCTPRCGSWAVAV